MTVMDADGAAAFTIVAQRKLAAAEDCLRHNAYPTARERLDDAARAIERAREALQGA